MKSILKLLTCILLLCFAFTLVACNGVIPPESTPETTADIAPPVTELEWKAKNALKMRNPGFYTHLELLSFESLGSLVESLDSRYQNGESEYDRSYFEYDRDYFKENSLILIQYSVVDDSDWTFRDVIPEGDGLKLVVERPALEYGVTSLGMSRDCLRLIEVRNYIPELPEIKLKAVTPTPNEYLPWTATTMELTPADSAKLLELQAVTNEAAVSTATLLGLRVEGVFEKLGVEYHPDFFNGGTLLFLQFTTNIDESIRILSVMQRGDGAVVFAQRVPDSSKTDTVSGQRNWGVFVHITYFTPEPSEITKELLPAKLPMTAFSLGISQDQSDALPNKRFLTFESFRALTESLGMDGGEIVRNLGIESFNEDYFNENFLLFLPVSTAAGERIDVREVVQNRGVKVIAEEVPDDTGEPSVTQERCWCVFVATPQCVPTPSTITLETGTRSMCFWEGGPYPMWD